MNKIFINNDFLNKQYQLHKILALIWSQGASDMIFIPMEKGVKIKFKKNYKTIFMSEDFYQYDKYEKLLNILILGTGLDPCTNEPQNSQFNFTINKKIYSIRVALQNSLHNKTLCLRLMENTYFQLDQFKLNSNFIDKLSEYKGLILIGGRTCSGKTSLLYSLLKNSKEHIITMEDPIESHIDNIIQTDVSQTSYEICCKSVLRQNPDTIVIGEIRDHTSAQTAIRCALTGHTVIATIHINHPQQVITRLEEMGCKYFLQTLVLIIFVENFSIKVYEFCDDTIKEITL